MIFGDEDGNICVWRIHDREDPRRILVQEAVHPGAIRLLAVDRDGGHVAVYGEGPAVSIWTVAEEIRPVASVKLASEAASSLLLDVSRRWVFVGESRGTVGIYSLDEQVRIARLISTDTGVGRRRPQGSIRWTPERRRRVGLGRGDQGANTPCRLVFRELFRAWIVGEAR